MPDNATHSTQEAASSAKRAAGRWKASCAVGQDLDTGAPLRRTAYGQTPSEAAVRLCDILKNKHQGE